MCLGSMAAGMFLVGGISFLLSGYAEPTSYGFVNDSISVLFIILYIVFIAILPTFVIPLLYLSLITETLLSISRFLAYVLCGTITFITVCFVVLTSIWSMILLPSELSKQEQLVVDCLFSVARIESLYQSVYHFPLPMDRLMDTFSVINPDKINLSGRIIQPDDLRDIRLLQSSSTERICCDGSF